MLFCEKLALIKETISSTGAALANEAGLAPSCVCRYLSAKNSPFRYGDAVARLARAAAVLAAGPGAAEALREAASARDGEKTPDAVERWLNGADSGLREKKSAGGPPSPKVDIADKLGVLMESFGTTNAELARYANLDGSSISRYRSGKRRVRRDDPILRSLCAYFSFLCKSRGVPRAVAKELEAGGIDDADCETLAARLFEWMCEDAEDRRWLSRGLLDAALHGGASAPCIDEGVDMRGRVYLDAGGVSAAFGEFARSSCERGDVYIYTSYLWRPAQELHFDGACAELMRVMMGRGHKIKSVHNIGFDAEDVFSMIEAWLPLFLTGNAEAYYLTRPNRSLFGEFMAASESCALRFSTLCGGSVRPRAFFSNSPEEAAFIREQVEGLMAYSKPLVKFYRKEDLEKIYTEAEECGGSGGDVIKLTRRPTLESMPESLAERVFGRAAPSCETRALLTRLYKKRRRSFLATLAHVCVTEIFPLQSCEDASAGSVRIALPWEAGLQASYTPDEYAAHMSALERLSYEHANYRAVRRASMPFSSIDVIVKEGTAACVAQNDGEPSAVSFLNSQVCYMLERYVKRFAKDGR